MVSKPSILITAATLLFLFPLPGKASCEGAEPRLQAATEALDQGNAAKAEEILKQVQRSHPQCNKVLLGTARARAEQGDTNSATLLLYQYTDLEPQDAKGHYYLARVLLSQGLYAGADLGSERAVSLAPDDPDALTLRGQLLTMQSKTIEAREFLEKACRLAPKNEEAHFQLGTLYDNVQLNSKAVATFEKVIALNPKNPRAYDYLALNLEPLGEIEKTEAAYKDGLRVNEGPLFDAFLDYNYGRFLMKQDRLTESKKHLDRALELSPNTRAVHYEHAKLNFLLKNFQEARVDAERALEIPDPYEKIQNLQVYYLLARIYTRLGETDLARKYSDLSRTTSVPIQTRERK